MSEAILGWHFVGESLRDGRPIPDDGVTLQHGGELALCKSGLHASIRIIDALNYAPGATICRVRCGGIIVESDDKIVASKRTILWRVDGDSLLREFARTCAMDVIHLWEAPPIVRQYLETGDTSLRPAAQNAAWAAARAAARDAAWAAARAAARDAARAAAQAARAAAWDAAQAARAAAWDAARPAAWDAARAAQAAARAQNTRLEAMVIAAHEK